MNNKQNQQIQSEQKLISNTYIKDNNGFKKNESSSLLNNIENNKNLNQKNNVEFEIPVQNSVIAKLNKNINQINISSSINNLRDFSSKVCNNLSSSNNQSINYQIVSNNLPHDDSMQKDINNILNLNNIIDTDEKQFYTIQNMKHSHSTKSFVFRKKVKPYNQSTLNHFVPEQILNSIDKNKNYLNNQDNEKKHINRLEKDLNKIKEEYGKIKKERNNYENLNRIIQSDIRNFTKQKTIEQDNFEKYKNEEIKKLTNERNKIINEKQILNELKKNIKNIKMILKNYENIIDNKN